MKQLYIFLEGPNDEMFFKQILEKKGFFSKEVGKVFYFQYSKKHALISKTIKSLPNNCSEILMVDADFQNNTHEKFLSCKRGDRYSLIAYAIRHYNFKKRENIFIVVEEIESWFLAGFSSDFCKKHNMRFEANTETISKELFSKIRIDKKHKNETPIELMSFLSRNHQEFCLVEAQKRNQSFRTFYQAINPDPPKK